MVEPEQFPHFSPEPLSEKICVAVGETEVPVSETKLRLLEEASNGATTATAANAMSMTIDEVESLRTDIIAELNVPNMAAAVSLVISQKLLDVRVKNNPPVRVSGQDAQILRLIAQGKTTAEIGEALGRQKEVARTICRNLFKKLEASGRAHSVRRAYEYGIFKIY